MPKIRVKNTELFYEQDYFGHEDTLLFSNSLGTDHTMWEGQIDILSHHFNIVRYDTRGHGQSDIPENDITIADLGNDVIALLNELSVNKAYFCGISMGGLIGQWLGINHPKRFKKIIISNTAAKIGTADSWDARIQQVTNHGMASILTGTAERWFTPQFRAVQPDEVNNILERFKNNNVKGYSACCRAIGAADFRNNLYELEVPTLVISGIRDEVTTVADGKYMAKRIPVASHIQLDAAHLSNIEQPEEFAKHILHFTQH